MRENRPVKINKQNAKDSRYSAGRYSRYSLTVPPDIATLVEERLGPDTYFRAELTEDGLLYRPLPRLPERPEDLPGWLNETGGGSK